MASSPVATGQRLSPLHTIHLRHGATMVDEAGWQRPQRYTDPVREAEMVRQGVGLLDLSPVGKIDVRGVEVSALLEITWPGMASVPTPLRAARPSAGGPLVCRLTEDEALVFAAPAERETTLELLEQRSALVGDCVHVLDLTSGQAGLRVAGPRARDLLRACTRLDLRDAHMPNLTLGQGSLARVHALVVRDDLPQLPAFSIFFDRDYAESVWDWLTHVGRELGLSPFGLAAQEILAGGGPS